MQGVNFEEIEEALMLLITTSKEDQSVIYRGYPILFNLLRCAARYVTIPQ